MDPYFDKPRRPLIGVWAGFWLGLAAVLCCFMWFATVQPELALKIVVGFVSVGGGLIIVMIMVLYILFG
jgi:hypothetical protein